MARDVSAASNPRNTKDPEEENEAVADERTRAPF